MFRTSSLLASVLAGVALAMGSVFVTPQPATAQGGNCAECKTLYNCGAADQGYCSCSFKNGLCQESDEFCPGCPADEITQSDIPDDHLREFELDGRTVVLARLDRDEFAAWGCDDRVSTLVRKNEDGVWKHIELTELTRRRSELPTWDGYLARFKGNSKGG